MHSSRIQLSLQQLEAFVQVAALGSFRAAAAQIGVSQPALSRTIRQAEQTLGARLFDRDTRHVTISPVGGELLPIAQRILREFDSAFSELGQFMQGSRGRVTVAALPSLGSALVPNAIAAFKKHCPQAEFTLMEAPAEVLLAAVEDGRADFGLSVRPAPDLRLQYQHLLDDSMVLLCRADDPLAGRSSVPWSVFAQRPFIASQPNSSIRPLTDAVFLQKGLSIRPAFESPSVSACGGLIGAGLGLAALPQLALDLVNMHRLVAVPLVRPHASRPIGVVTRIGRTLPPVGRAFITRVLALHDPRVYAIPRA
ncbi:LysR family transcriptional regulator [Ottowia sp.]|uniref:LysR family transcriptional regulator n=1 Tax=Ottowia sp. TaxID=1898956 RepID=UPI003A849539